MAPALFPVSLPYCPFHISFSDFWVRMGGDRGPVLPAAGGSVPGLGPCPSSAVPRGLRPGPEG